MPMRQSNLPTKALDERTSVTARPVSGRRRSGPGEGRHATLDAHNVMALQSAVGNRAALRVIATLPSGRAPTITDGTPRTAHRPMRRTPSGIETKRPDPVVRDVFTRHVARPTANDVQRAEIDAALARWPKPIVVVDPDHLQDFENWLMNVRDLGVLDRVRRSLGRQLETDLSANERLAVEAALRLISVERQQPKRFGPILDLDLMPDPEKTIFSKSHQSFVALRSDWHKTGKLPWIAMLQSAIVCPAARQDDLDLIEDAIDILRRASGVELEVLKNAAMSLWGRMAAIIPVHKSNLELVGQKDGAGWWDKGRNTVWLATGACKAPSLAQTLLHELTHVALNDTYRHGSRPYAADDDQGREETLEAVLKEWKLAAKSDKVYEVLHGPLKRLHDKYEKQRMLGPEIGSHYLELIHILRMQGADERGAVNTLEGYLPLTVAFMKNAQKELAAYTKRESDVETADRDPRHDAN